jgi:hypothetical protein
LQDDFWQASGVSSHLLFSLKCNKITENEVFNRSMLGLGEKKAAIGSFFLVFSRGYMR